MTDTPGRHRKGALMIRRAAGPICSIPQPLLHFLLRSLIVLLTCGCATVTVDYAPPIPSPPPPVAINRPPSAPPQAEAKPKPKATIGYASWYGPGLDGHKTATGERFSSARMTAAARGIPLGSQVLVTNLMNGRSATVRINDCGPLRHGRKVDLTKRAARKIGIIHDGAALVRITIIAVPRGATLCHL
jgi:rare lipoprotein A